MSTGDLRQVTCSSDCHCQYRFQNTIGWGCNYCGYCDFQLPRDSREQLLSVIPEVKNHTGSDVDGSHCLT